MEALMFAPAATQRPVDTVDDKSVDMDISLSHLPMVLIDVL